EFSEAIAAFLAGKGGFAELEAALVRALELDPSAGPAAYAELDRVYRGGRLPLQLFVVLKNRIAQSHASASPPPRARATPPPSPRDAARPAQSGTPAAPSSEPPAGSPAASAPLRADATVFSAPQRSATAAPASAATPSAAGRPAAPPAAAASPVEPHAGGDHTIMRAAPRAAPEPEPPNAASPAAPPPSFDVGGPATGSHGNTGSRTGAPFTGRSGTGSSVSSWTDASRLPEQPLQALERGSVLKGRFVLENVVGRGGMGVVFRAKDLRKEEAQDRDPYVAIKILNDEFRRHPESLKALQREARKSQQLAHPNIVSVFDFDRDGGTVYMTMEYLEGESLDRIIKNPKFEGMALTEAYPLIRGLGSALSYAHDKGIVHSDFKPGNCFVTKTGIKVFDFGIAQAAKIKGELKGEETKFDAGTLGALTPAYASCEMIDGEAPDTRDDIYALGCVVYEMLTGKHPFGKKSAADAREQKLLPLPIKRLTRRQWRAIEKSLAFKRADRCGSVWELVDGLAKRQLFTAPRIAVGAAAVVVLGVGAYFGVGAWQQAQRGRLVEALSSREDARVTPALQRLGTLEAVDRITVLQEVSAPLLDWYIARIDAAVDERRQRYDFPGAAALVAEAKNWFPDSARLTMRETMLESRKNELLQELDQRFNDNLQAGRLLDDPQGEDIVDVLTIVSQVDPGHKLLSDPRLSFAYAERATAALEAADVARARPLIDAGLARDPGNAQLTDLRDKLT
ncbi:MAG TPA: serine/threonine-protein kinase, partial [Gammaproteobacteria bacterium]|nr:serine/threonine-protein kinase [Gammaproteobacteria bacterium]